jgi:hypothetical protein
MGQKGIGGVSIIVGAMLAAIMAAISIPIIGSILAVYGVGNSTTYFTGNGAIGAGLWSLIPLLLPATVILIILIAVYMYFRPLE